MIIRHWFTLDFLYYHDLKTKKENPASHEEVYYKAYRTLGPKSEYKQCFSQTITKPVPDGQHKQMRKLNPFQNKSTCIAHRVWMIIVVVLSLCSTQIFAQGVTVGSTTDTGASMLNVKPIPNGPGLSVGDAAHIDIPAPPNGAAIQGQLLVGTTTVGDVKVFIDGTGHIVALQIQGGMYLTQPDKSFILTGASGNCWLLGVEEQMDGLTAIPKCWKVTCPPW